jgi:hypothetical protein
MSGTLNSGIYEAAWWLEPEPIDDDEHEIWMGRAAFLDSLYYEPKG